jgi:uncharacterized protein (TIGR03435 family)
MSVLFHRLQLCVAFAAVAAGQVQRPKNNHYEVVSIKPGVPAKVGGYHSSPLQLRLDNWSLVKLIGFLYDASRGYDLVGMPKWASSETFTFVAKSVSPANPGEQYVMLRPVLEDRFKLKYHREQRQMPVYFLSAAPGGIRFPVTVPGSCQPIDPNVGPVPPVQRPGEPKPPNNCAMWMNQILPGGGVKLSAKGITMFQLGRALVQYFDRPLVERTGSTKLFDVDLSFVKSDLSAGDTNDEPSGLPTIVGALKKVGLSATRGQGPVDVMVIDRLERPSED